MADHKIPASPQFGAQRTTPVVRGHQRGTITHMGGGAWVVTLDEPEDFSDPRSEPSISTSAGDSGSPADAGWCIDLDHHTGRQHVAEAIIATFPALCIVGGVMWRMTWCGSLEILAWRADGSRLQGVAWAPWAPPAGAMELYEQGNWCRQCGALATLNPTDDTRLPDGSRAVDRDALAIVALHTLGARVGLAVSP